MTRSLIGQSLAVSIPVGEVLLKADLTIPHSATSVVVFAHGSGSSRHSNRNRFVAAELQAAGLGTLLMDLLTESEESVDDVSGHLRFDIPLLAQRLTAATDWITTESATRALPVQARRTLRRDPLRPAHSLYAEGRGSGRSHA